MPLPNTDDFDADYAGIKQDYSEPIDPTTDLPAAASNNARASTAGMTRVIHRVSFVWINDGTDASITFFESVIGNNSINKPVVAKTGTGIWTATFPASCTDLLGEEKFWNFQYGKGYILSSTGPRHVQCVVTAPNVIVIYLWNELGVLNDCTTLPILIEIR